MAGKCRIKVLLDNVQPFWMFVDVQQCPHISDIEQKIKNQCINVHVESLWLDGCILPSYESTELLRDNDAIHVKTNECNAHDHVHGVLPANKKDPKKKQTDVGTTCKPESSSNDPERGTTDTFVTGSESKKKRETSKKEKKKRKRNDSFDEDSSVVTDSALLSKANVCEKHKKYKANDSAEKDSSTDNSKSAPMSGHDVLSANKQAVKSEIRSLKDKLEPVNSVEVIAASSSIADAPNREKKKRGRRRKKGSLSQKESPPEDASQGPIPTCPDPAPLRLPKWNQPQSKKIVFSSDDENSTTMTTAEADQAGSDIITNTSQLSSTVSASSNSESRSAFSSNNVTAEYMDSSNINNTGSCQLKCSVDNGESRFGDSARNSGMSINGTGSNNATEVNTGKTNGAVEEVYNQRLWSGNEQYQNKYLEHQRMRKQSPHPKTTTPDYFHNGGQQQAIQSNLAEHLMMSPQERGVETPPYVTARRLPNGAMVYSRNRVCEDVDHTGTQSMTLQPVNKASPVNQSATPRELSKQQQLASVVSNKSIIIRNSTFAEAIAEKGDGLLRQEAAGDIILTPIGREYSLFPDLTAAPKVGDTIAYKVLEMGEDYTPGISDFKEAEVLGYDAASQVVTVKPIINEFTAGKKKPGRFDLPEEDTEEEQVVELELSSMFEPKLMNSAYRK